MTSLPFPEYSEVRVTQLLGQGRHYWGTDGVCRPPEVGDTGTIVYIVDWANPTVYIVESLDQHGYTVWVADFVADELALVR